MKEDNPHPINIVDDDSREIIIVDDNSREIIIVDDNSREIIILNDCFLNYRDVCTLWFYFEFHAFHYR